MQQFGLEVLANQKIAEFAMQHYLYMPLANTFTLGIYGMVAPVGSIPEAETSEA